MKVKRNQAADPKDELDYKKMAVALEAVTAALRPLPQEAQRRIVRSVAILLEVDLSDSTERKR